MRQSERRCIAADIPGAILACLDRSRGPAAQRPLDRDRTRAGADVPQPLAGTCRQGGKRECADRPLGDLAVMDEEIVCQARTAGYTLCAPRLQSHRNQVSSELARKAVST